MLESLGMYIANEWAVLIGAPVTFLMAASCIVVLVWSGVRWSYMERIDNLNGRLAARTEEIERLKNKLAEAHEGSKRRAPSDPDEIFQTDRNVGKLIGPDIRRGDGIVLAKVINANGDFDPQKPFDYRDMRLSLVRCEAEARTNMAGLIRSNYHTALCQIIE